MKDAAQIVALMLEDDIERVCAWCQKERGEPPQPGQSHGICQRHKEEMTRGLDDLKTQQPSPVNQLVQPVPPLQ